MKFSPRVTGVMAAVGLLSLALGACGGGSSGSEDSGTSSGPVTINYWSWDGAPGQDIVKLVIAAFEKANPTITVKYTEIPQADYKPKAASALAAKEDIDVLGVQPGAWAGEVEDFLSPVSEWPGGDELPASFSDATIAQAKRLFTDGELYAVPLYSTGSAVGIYNAGLLKKLGVEPPTTWAQFKTLSDKLKSEKSKVLPATMPGDDWFQDEVALTVVGQSDPTFFDKARYDKAAWNTPSYVSGLQQYKALFDDGTFDKATLDMDYATAMTTFESGKSAIAFNGSWEANRILTGDYGVIPFPAQSEDNASLRSFLDVTLGIPEQSEKKAAAEKFIAFMSTGDGVDAWATKLKGIPAVKDYTLPEGTLTTDLQKKSYATLVSLISNPHSDRNNLGAFSDFAGANVKQVVSGDITAQAAADSDEKKLKSGNF